MDDLEKKVVEAIDYVRPSLQNDGGDVSALGTDELGCGLHSNYSLLTLQSGSSIG